MVRTLPLAVMVAAVTMMLTACNGYAAPLAELKIGDAAPDWSGIIGVDGKEHSLSEYSKAKLVVLVFTCNHCPWAINWEDSLIAVQKDYGKKGVQVVAVNVNNIRADRLEPMKVRARGEDRKNKEPFNFPYLYDASQKMGYDYGAKFTPHVFLLDKDRKIAFIGAIDDRTAPGKKGEKQYLRDALDALLAGKKPATAETRARGCTIKYDK